MGPKSRNGTGWVTIMKIGKPQPFLKSIQCSSWVDPLEAQPKRELGPYMSIMPIEVKEDIKVSPSSKRRNIQVIQLRQTPGSELCDVNLDSVSDDLRISDDGHDLRIPPPRRV